MKEPCFVLNNKYEKSYVESLDLVQFDKVKEIDALIYIGIKKVYFFEKTSDEKLKLYSILNKSSFYLN
jgi:hypothetical protein